VCGESRTHGDNGGDGETGRKIPRSVPTHSQLLGSLVATLLDVKAWESLPMPAERERGCKSKRRGPCAVKVARTVPTGGMERRVKGYRALSLPTKAVHMGKGHSL